MSSKDRMVHVSKEMSYMLRHRPPPGAHHHTAVHNSTSTLKTFEQILRCSFRPYTLTYWLPRSAMQPTYQHAVTMRACLSGMTSDGYISLPALLTHMKHKPTEQEIRATVSCDVKVHAFGICKLPSLFVVVITDCTYSSLSHKCMLLCWSLSTRCLACPDFYQHQL